MKKTLEENCLDWLTLQMEKKNSNANVSNWMKHTSGNKQPTLNYLLLFADLQMNLIRYESKHLIAHTIYHGNNCRSEFA